MERPGNFWTLQVLMGYRVYGVDDYTQDTFIPLKWTSQVDSMENGHTWCNR